MQGVAPRGPDVRSAGLVVALCAALIGCGSGAAAPNRDASSMGTDAASPDAPDAPPADGPESDGAASDAWPADASSLDATTVAPPPGPYPRPTYTRLAETGLLADAEPRRISADALPFEPTYWLWSDGADKRRWLRLPPGTQIDTTVMDHWVFPIGTKLWKEFSLGGVLLETRLIERYGDGPEDYWMGAFVWNAEQTDAVLAPEGQADINGTFHDAPAQKDCLACHRGEAGRVLGFSALQLSRPADAARVGPTIADLVRQGLLTAPPDGGAATAFSVPGDPAAAAALGYLHANCGHCHNRSGTAWPDAQMVLRLETDETDVTSSALYRSLVGQPLQYWRGGAITQRIVAGDPDASAIVARMSARGDKDQMPPLATEKTDPTGIAKVRAWIASLPSAGAP